MSKLSHSNPYFDDVLTDIDIRLGVIFKGNMKMVEETYLDQLENTQAIYHEWEDIPFMRMVKLCMTKAIETDATWDAFLHGEDPSITEKLLAAFVSGDSDTKKLLNNLQANVVDFYEEEVREDFLNL
jgi:hypothetical protein